MWFAVAAVPLVCLSLLIGLWPSNPALAVVTTAVVLASMVLLFGVLVGHRVEVRGDRVHWQALVRRRVVPLADLTGNGTAYPGGIAKLKCRTGPTLYVYANDRGWSQFLDALNQVHPDRPFRPTRIDRWVAAVPWSGIFNGFVSGTTPSPAAALPAAAWPPPQG